MLLAFSPYGGTVEESGYVGKRSIHQTYHREHHNEKAFGDPDALAAHIIDALTENGLLIVPEDTALGDQPFDELTPEMRPQDPSGYGKGWRFQTSEHGGAEPDTMPQAIEASDSEGRSAIYVPLSRGGKIVMPRRERR